MAAIDKLQRQLDANALRISNLGTPTTAGDATKTDNSTAPADPAGAAAAGASLLAAPVNHVHRGVASVLVNGAGSTYGNVNLKDGAGISVTVSGQDVTFTASSSTVNKITWADDSMAYNPDGATERIVREWVVNLDDAGGGAGNNIAATVSGIVLVSAGTGTYKLYIGATAPRATAGGTSQVSFTTVSTTEVKAGATGSSFSNPGGRVSVQLVAVNSGAGNTQISGFSITIG